MSPQNHDFAVLGRPSSFATATIVLICVPACTYRTNEENYYRKETIARLDKIASVLEVKGRDVAEGMSSLQQLSDLLVPNPADREAAGKTVVSDALGKPFTLERSKTQDELLVTIACPPDDTGANTDLVVTVRISPSAFQVRRGWINN